MTIKLANMQVDFSSGRFSIESEDGKPIGHGRLPSPAYAAYREMFPSLTDEQFAEVVDAAKQMADAYGGAWGFEPAMKSIAAALNVYSIEP